MAWLPPSVADFSSFFNRDFAYAPEGVPANDLDYVQPSDITRAINEAVIDFNPGLYGSLAQITNIFMYLAAYHLVENLKNSMKGIAAQANFPTASQGAGGVNASYQIPERYLKSPILAPYTQNGYGMRYLALVLPFLVGNVSAPGSYNPTPSMVI
jgi:hypothetical protein